jgi:hypothetical protein
MTNWFRPFGPSAASLCLVVIVVSTGCLKGDHVTTPVSTSTWVEEGPSSTPFETRVLNLEKNFEETWRVLSVWTGKRPPVPALRVYRSRERFLADLARAGFERQTVEYFRRTGGAPRPMHGTLWVPPDMKPSGVCHELTHSFIDVLAGGGYLRAKWLDEGFASWFEETECGSPGFDPPYPIAIPDMTAEEQWSRLREADASRLYRSAAGVVRKLVAKYGPSKILDVFSTLRSEDLPQAIRLVLGIDMREVEAIANAGDPPWLEPDCEPEPEVYALYKEVWSYLAKVAQRPLPAPPRLRMYCKRDAFLSDLRALGWDDASLGLFAQRGEPRPLPGEAWALWAPAYDPFAVCRDLTYAFAAALSGDGFRRAAWLDRGFASHIAWSVCNAPPMRMPADPIPLASLATEAEFRARSGQGAERAAESSWAAVERLSTRFGDAKLAELLAELRSSDLDSAMRKILGIGVECAEADSHCSSRLAPPVMHVPLIGEAGLFFADVTVGGTDFRVTVDTGSTTTAIASASCANCQAAGNRYRPGRLAADTHSIASTTYGGGSGKGWSGRVLEDSITFGGRSLFPRVKLVAIDSQTGVLGVGGGSPHELNDGILGLGPTLAAMPGTTSFSDAWLAVHGNSDLFAVALCPSAAKGHVWFGGYDVAFAASTPAYTPMSERDMVRVTDIAIGGVTLALPEGAYGDALVDSGSPVSQLPPKVFRALVAVLEKNATFQHVFGGNPKWSLWSGCAPIPLPFEEAKRQFDENLPPVDITFGKNSPVRVQFPASESYLRFVNIGGKPMWCGGIVAGAEAPSFMTLGSPLMQGKIVVFDREKRSMGFAQVRKCE